MCIVRLIETDIRSSIKVSAYNLFIFQNKQKGRVVMKNIAEYVIKKIEIYKNSI